MITVFTPTYNRSYIIKKLYLSLLCQTYKDFEWLIVDDGSTDDTQDLLLSIMSEKKIQIRYFKQENGGKHRAINRGVQEANGELFFIVDSDDYLAENALERVHHHWSNVKDDAIFAGVCGIRVYPDGQKVGSKSNFVILDCCSLDFKFKYKIKGDAAEVFKTDILKMYRFPDIPGENFCAESLIWNRIARKFKIRYFQEPIYICEYLPDGLSCSFLKNRVQSPRYATLLYKELSMADIPFFLKAKSLINYWRFAFHLQRPFTTKISEVGIMPIFLIPLSFLFFVKDYYLLSSEKKKNL